MAPRLPARALLLAASAVVGLGGLGGCGVFKKVSAPKTVPPLERRAPLADVRSELPTLVIDGNKAAADAQVGAFDDAESEADHLESAWSEVEGTVRADDRSDFDRIVQDQGRIKTGAVHHQLAQIERAADDQSSAVDHFLDLPAKTPS